MAVYYSFFDSVMVNNVPDRPMTAKDLVRYYSALIGNGIRANPSTTLQVLQDTNMRVKVAPGIGFIKGHIFESDSDFYLTLDNADGVLKRIDRIVLRLDYTNRLMELAIKKGAYNSTPVAPTLQRDSDKYELALADILVNNGVTTITQANITDTRLNTSLCGYITGLFQQLDTTTIYNQFEAALNERKQDYSDDFLIWSAQQREAFDSWFTTIRDILNTNDAANLLNQITDHKDVNNIAAHSISNISGLTTALNRKAETITLTNSLSANGWRLGSSGHYQTLDIAGITSSDNPIISPNYTSNVAVLNASIKREWSKVGKADTGTGTITFYCFGNAPNATIPIQIKVVR